MERIQMRPDLIMYSNKKGGEKVYFGLTKTYKYDFFCQRRLRNNTFVKGKMFIYICNTRTNPILIGMLYKLILIRQSDGKKLVQLQAKTMHFPRQIAFFAEYLFCEKRFFPLPDYFILHLLRSDSNYNVPALHTQYIKSYKSISIQSPPPNWF